MTGKNFARLLSCLAVAAVIIGAALPAHANDALLSAERWREDSFGLSLRPPLGSKLIEQSADSALLRVVGDSYYLMAVFIRASEKLVDVAEVQQYALNQVGFTHPSAIILEQAPLEFQGQPGAMFLFELPEDPKQNRGKWVIGQTVVQLDPSTVAVIQVEMPREQLETVRPIYDAMIKSIEFEDPDLLQAQRAEAVARGEAWLLGLDARRLHQARIADQWFRVIDRDREIGFIRIQQKADTAVDQSGLRVDLHARLHSDQYVTESVSNFFISDDLDNEVWSIRTTTRQVAIRPGGAPEREATWAETGVRSGGRITITRETPSGKRQHNWERPESYLPQVVAHMITSLLPQEVKSPKDGKTPKPGLSEPMGFYSYYPNTGKLAYRTEQVNLKADGSYEIISRPTPEQQEQVSHYGADGKLIRRTLPSGWVMLPATAAQMRAKWNVQ